MGFLTPPAKKPLLAADKIDKEYSKMRLKVFLGIYLGYAAYYLVRKNLSLAAPGMIDQIRTCEDTERSSGTPSRSFCP